MGNSRNCRIIPDWIADYRTVGWAESAVLRDQAQDRSYAGRAGIRPTGREVALPMVFVCDIHDGRILRANLYYDTGILLRQLGLA
jgi:ketosteroid isomerase-like protein